jgi:hypothetical protein
MKLTWVFHELWALFWEGLSGKEQKAYAFRVDTDRSTGHPPGVAPYNSGIDETWYEANKDSQDPDIQLLIRDWMTYGDMESFTNFRLPSNLDEADNASE